MYFNPYRLASCLVCLSSVCLVASGAPAPQPQWLGAAVPASDQATVFSRDFTLPQAPAKALLRLDARDRYRLAVNGRTVSVGDTPWDAETYDVTGLLTQGTNSVAVTVDADETPFPANCYMWLRRKLPAPAPFTRLSFKTRGAQADEWLYIVSSMPRAPLRASTVWRESGRI